MRIRNYRIFKLITLLLFSLELLVPSLNFAGQGDDLSLNRQILHFSKHSTIQLFLYTEENTEGEGKSGQKDVAPLEWQNLSIIFKSIFQINYEEARKDTSLARFKTRPELYTLHCLYRI